MIRLAAILALTLMLAACSGSGGSTTSPTDTAGGPPSASPKVGDFHFYGAVRATSRACIYDAVCALTVEVSDPLDSGLRAGQQVTVIESYGFGVRRCFGRWSEETSEGAQVEVLVHWTEHPDDLAICDNETYYVNEIATQSPTPMR